METEAIIYVSCFAVAAAILLVTTIVLFIQVWSLKKRVYQLENSARLRVVQKLKLDNMDKNHDFQNPVISPNEELSKRGYSMYAPDMDVESGRGSDRTAERQTGGQLVEQLTKELEFRHQRQQDDAPPFLMQGIEEARRKTREDGNQGRQSETNPNFIYY